MATPTLLEYFQPFAAAQNGLIDLTGIIDIKDFSEVNFQILNYPNPVPLPNSMRVVVFMGKLNGLTLGQRIDFFPFDLRPAIRTYKVTGPELAIMIWHAPPNANLNIQAWVFLH